jgi:hypothetical protein
MTVTTLDVAMGQRPPQELLDAISVGFYFH